MSDPTSSSSAASSSSTGGPDRPPSRRVPPLPLGHGAAGPGDALDGGEDAGGGDSTDYEDEEGQLLPLLSRDEASQGRRHTCAATPPN